MGQVRQKRLNGILVEQLQKHGHIYLRKSISHNQFSNHCADNQKKRETHRKKKAKGNKVNKRRMAMKKTVIAALILFLALSNLESFTAGPADCYDACSTACVQSDTRLMQRCDRKCQIRCGPDSVVKRHVNHVIKD